MSKPIAQIYQEAWDLFQDKNRWHQGFYQVDKDGNCCGWAEGYAFCAIGALNHFTNGWNHTALCALQRISEHLYGKYIQVVNDSEDGYHKVLQALQFGVEFWKDRDPTDEEITISIKDVMERRNATHT